ncbi:MAG: NAD(P)-binding domain-containing protein, partial [Actinobacteria bacterium]|nr:NAD(P)-binding domain-containing protein [Actinomycetota bacterium]NIV59348.1 NAD(P)-binding domain-containing protein [Actinomycetota bacterium]
MPFDWFEIGSGIGGNWRYGNDNGRSAAYDSLHIDTSKDRMAYSDFPMPEEFPNYLHHSQVLEYFESYAERFALNDRVTLRTRVERVDPLDEGGYRVTVENLATDERRSERYSDVLVCNGHHWCRRMPDFPGTFDGEMLHSRDYRNPDGLEGKVVLVLGVGNSGVDIACDVAPVAARTLLASRRGAHVIPRHLLGRPTDKWTTPASSRLPLGVQR